MKKSLIFIFMLVFASVCYPQEKTDKATIIEIEADANSCEQNSLYIDVLQNELAKADEKVFVVIRKTKNETNYVRQQRLLQIRNIFLGYKGFSKEKVIFAEGEDDERQGKVEFYLGSKLFFVALARKNLRICWDCCFVPYDDYLKVPKIKKILKKKQK